MTATSPLLGFICLLLLFLTCIIIVLGVRSVLSILKKPTPKPTAKKPKRKTINPKPIKSIRTIQIDPDEIDKIYVGKMR